MKFAIRADASWQIGSGHVMRCLTLATALRQSGHEILFLMRAHVGHLAELVAQHGFTYVLLPEKNHAHVSGDLAHSAWLGTSQMQDFADCLPHLCDFAPDWLVCDHYALDSKWQCAAQNTTGAKILVIDDLHDREHFADILLDQNFGHCTEDYADLIPPSCRVLTGTRYALLRDEFAQWRKRSLQRRNKNLPENQTILLNLGGVDKDNITLTILHDLAQRGFVGRVNVIMGKSAPHIAAVQAFAHNTPFDCQVMVNANNMAQQMAVADWAIGAAGSTSWERCCLGLPTLLLVIADNQREIAQQLQTMGAAIVCEASEIGTEKWGQSIEYLQYNHHRISQNAAMLCDGLGVKRVLNHLLNSCLNSQIRHATPEDSHLLYTWRNHADIRRFMLNTAPIEWEQHQQWFAAQAHNPNYIILIYQENNENMGSVNFKHLHDNVWEWGFYTAPNAPRGTGSKMAQLALAWAFRELNAHQVQGQVRAHNIASIKLHEKLGFTRQMPNGDLISYSLNSNNWEY